MVNYKNEYYLVASGSGMPGCVVDHATDFLQSYVRTYDVMEKMIRISVWNFDSNTAWLYVSVYLMA